MNRITENHEFKGLKDMNRMSSMVFYVTQYKYQCWITGTSSAFKNALIKRVNALLIFAIMLALAVSEQSKNGLGSSYSAS